jgi:hypothetical protein
MRDRILNSTTGPDISIPTRHATPGITATGTQRMRRVRPGGWRPGGPGAERGREPRHRSEAGWRGGAETARAISFRTPRNEAGQIITPTKRRVGIPSPTSEDRKTVARPLRPALTPGLERSNAETGDAGERV